MLLNSRYLSRITTIVDQAPGRVASTVRCGRHRRAISALALFICCALSSGCGKSASDGTELGFNYNSNSPQSSAIAAHKLPPLNADFDQQRNAIRQHLSHYSMSQRSAQAIELNLPFQRSANPSVAYRGRFLLFHGLNDSPYVWHDIANALVARGFDVRAVLFEGHGSTPRAMLDVSYHDWLQTAREHLALWRSNDVPMYLGGFSLGAVVATLLAIEQPDLAGLLLMSPAYHSQLNRYLRWSGVYARFRPWVFGGMILEDNPIKYNSIPVNSGWQFYRTTVALKRAWLWRKINIPTVMAVTDNDSVVDIDYVRRKFRKKFIHPKRRLLTYQQAPLAQASNTEHFQLSTLPEARIINQSHLGLMYRPDNPLFGRHGTVLVCNGNEYPIFIACMRASGHWYGAQHTPSPDGVPVARTTWNPHFDDLIRQIDQTFTASARLGQ